MSQVFYSISSMQENIAKKERVVATMGFFDGVHLGHRALLEETRKMAKQMSAKSMVVTLDQHPMRVLFPDRPHPLLLSSLKRKVQLIAESDIDYILVLPFTQELAKLSSEEFLRPLIECGLVGMMLGYDNRFGRRMEGETLEIFDERLRGLGLEINRITEFKINGALVSSSAIRHCLKSHDIEGLEALLGRTYSFLGIVKQGRQIGRTINYPTANIEPYDADLAMPPVGIYVAEVRVQESVYPAMAYYGSSPTVTGGNQAYRLEAYLFGYAGNLYQEEVEIAFRTYLRDDVQFKGLDALSTQLKKDEEATIAYYASHKMTLQDPRQKDKIR